jgi:hydroxyethylthiazole kinase
MLIAGGRANELGVPVIYDPVGVGATRYRNETGERILKGLKVAVIRGNSGEVGALAGAGGLVKGVESVEGVKDPVGVAKALAERESCVVAITGKRDIVSDGKRTLGVDNGHEMMKIVTGTGCMSTTMVAIFNAVESDRLVATAAALACYGIAGEDAARHAKGPGSFRSELLDALYNLTEARVRAKSRIVEL